MLKAGTVIKFEKDNQYPFIDLNTKDVTLDKLYTIVAVDSDGDAYFVDDVGDPNYGAAAGGGDFIPTIVSK